jgi:hypothetical protein
MSSEPGTKTDLTEMVVELKNPALAAFLAWLVPGLGHIYQGRWAKGLLFSVSILGTFFLGLFLGSNSDVGPGRVVYFSGEPFRPHYLCQVWAGVVALPAIYQYREAKAGKTDKDSPLGRFMWPPNERRGEGDQLHYSLHRFFELGTVYTMIAGLLNILAIFDAGAGPAPLVDDPKKTPADKAATENNASKEGAAPPAGTPSTGASGSDGSAKPGEKT